MKMTDDVRRNVGVRDSGSGGLLHGRKDSLLSGQVQHTATGRRLDYPPMETMGDRIRVLREARGLSQQQLADKLGVTKGAVGQWERGLTKNVKNLTMLALCDVLQTDQKYLLFGPDRKPDAPALGKARS